jgi:diguanylate cyclase (GGDEF)-like protein
MAASDPDRAPELLPQDAVAASAAELAERLAEEIERSERHSTPLTCLLVVVDNLDSIAAEHGEELVGQTLTYLSRALRQELRRFDRVGRTPEGELLILLPGADGPRGEIVARRVVERVGAVKVEVAGARLPLSVSVGLAAWESQMDVEELLSRARDAARRRNGEDPRGRLAEAGRAGVPGPEDRQPRRQGGVGFPGSSGP